MNIDATSLIRQEAERLAAALTATDPEQRVPTCPDWTADDLLWHLTEVHEFWAGILSAGATTAEEAEAIDAAKPPRPEQREELLGRRAAATESLLAQLELHDDQDPAWFWSSAQHGVGITRRMQTHEATIHRVDAELTAGRPVSAIEPAVAADGLAHVLEVMWPAAFEWIPDWAETSAVAVVEIRGQGGSQRRLLLSRWRGTRPRDGKEFDVPVGRLLSEADEAVADLPSASATGSALALNLWAWGREQALAHLASGAEQVRIHGDEDAMAELEALVAEGHD